VQARNGVASAARAGMARSYARFPASAPQPAAFTKYGSPRDGTAWGTGTGETTDPTLIFDTNTAGWGVRNVTAWEAASRLHWGRFMSDGKLSVTNGQKVVTCDLNEFKPWWVQSWIKIKGVEYTVATYTSPNTIELDLPYSGLTDAGLKEWQIADVALYDGFYFTAERVRRKFASGDDTVAGSPWLTNPSFMPKIRDWEPKGDTPGLAVEDGQATDWDGYGLMDLDRDGVPDTDRGTPFPSAGPILPDNLGIPGANTFDNNPFRILYNSNRMENYILRIRVRVMWNVKIEEDIYKYMVHGGVGNDDAALRNREKSERVYSHNEYFFSVFNSDTVRRWQP